MYSILFITTGNELIIDPFGIIINILLAFVPLNLDPKVNSFIEEQDKQIIDTSSNRIVLFIVDTSS